MPVLADDNYATRLVRLQSDGEPIAVLLQRSLREALAPFHRLQTTLLADHARSACWCRSSAACSPRAASRGPIAALTQFSRRIGQGDYAEPIEVTHQDEIGELATAFNQMQEGIAERERRITELAYMDRLTGLPNRALFNDRLQQAIGVALRAGHPLSA